IPLPGWLDLLLTHLDDPVVAAVAPRIVAADPGRFWMRGYETACSALDMGPAPARVRPRTRVPYVPSAALAVRPDRLPPAPEGAGVGPFDERMRVAEDVDLCWRTDAAGARIRYEPASRIAHRHRTRAARLLARREFYGRGAALLAEPHGAHVAPAVVAPRSLAATAGVGSLTPLGLAAADAAAARGRSRRGRGGGAWRRSGWRGRLGRRRVPGGVPVRSPGTVPRPRCWWRAVSGARYVRSPRRCCAPTGRSRPRCCWRRRPRARVW